ncbi:MAG TPA: SRPBCC domain-containing protein, partial [Candidatus Polarisedimenticolaceae bacterium]|nr:SRPBCC domain-containing protein [Candidatus Polarisedimenticolaceae bacterium]
MIQAKTGMLVRRPVAEVYEAFVDPEITRRFWFTKGSGRLEKGRRVQWEWEMYGISVPVDVKELEPHKIVIEWSGPKGANRVEWFFTEREDGTTFVEITNDGFHGDAEDVAHQAAESAAGFSFVLAGAKAYLEHGIELNLVKDRFPKGEVKTPASHRDAAVEFLKMAASGDVKEAFRRHVGPGFKHHNAFFPGDGDSLLRAMEDNAKQNPGKVLEVKQVIAQGDRVAVFSHVRQSP